MKKLLLVLLFSLGLMEASSNKEKEEVLKVIKNYANSVACATTFDIPDGGTSIKDVILAYKDNFGETSYFVLWGGDISCAGGTGTSSYYISEVGKYRDTNPFLVIQRDVFSFLEDINFRAIIRFKKLDENKYEIVSIDYGNDDSNCCPSLKQKYIVSQVKGSWKVLEKTFIEKIKY